MSCQEHVGVDDLTRNRAGRRQQQLRQSLREELTAAVEPLVELRATPLLPEQARPTWLTEKLFSEHTGIAFGTLRAWRLKREVLPFMKLGSLVRYDLDEVDQAIRSQRQDVGQ